MHHPQLARLPQVLAVGILVLASISLGNAQTITLRNSSSNACQYTSLALTAGGNIVVECVDGQGGGTQPGTVGFASPASSVSANGSAATIAVNRVGSTAGTVASVPYNCLSDVAGYNPSISPAASGSLSFTGDESRSITVTPGALPSGTSRAIVTCTLGTPSGGAALGTFTSHALSVTQASSGTNCSDGPVAATLDLASDDSRSKDDIVFANGETGAVSFKATRFSFSRLRYLIYWSVTQNIPLNGWQASISLCRGAGYDAVPPGNEANPNNCRITDVFNEGGIDISTQAPFKPYECVLEPGRIYYMNLRWINPSNGGPGCPTGTCGMRNGLQYR